MEYWPPLVKNPTGNKSLDEFAVAIDKVPKIVFSRTLKNVEWKTARLATRDLKDEVLELRQSRDGETKDIFVGSPGLINDLAQLGLIDEFQLCVHPVILGSGLPLFKNIKDKINLELLKTKTFGCGAIILYYQPK
jgi:dihydrofolate reductase